MLLEWNEAKERRNVKKHGLDFSLARLLVRDPLGIVVYDRFENGEHRYHLLATARPAWFWFTPIPTRTTKIGFASSACERLRHMKEGTMKQVVMREGEAANLTEAQRAQLAALDDVTPDTNDIPEAPAANWDYARRFYKPRKEPISIRLDADVLDWLRRRGDRYQTEINRILRLAMEAEGGADAPVRGDSCRVTRPPVAGRCQIFAGKGSTPCARARSCIRIRNSRFSCVRRQPLLRARAISSAVMPSPRLRASTVCLKVSRSSIRRIALLLHQSDRRAADDDHFGSGEAQILYPGPRDEGQRVPELLRQT